MKISVVTVTYNSAATLRDTLHSVVSQSYGDIEHIVVDGASTDGTIDILREYEEHLARVTSEPDSGIYDAMNKGLALATGDMVGFLNSDDVFADSNVVAEIAYAADRPGVDATFGDLQYVDGRGDGRTIRHWRSGEFRPSRLFFGWMPPHPTFYVRRSLLQRYGAFDSGLRIAADYDFLLRYLVQPGMNAVYIKKVLVRMRTGGASNRSLRALLRKSAEDLNALRRNKVGGVFTLICKNARKVFQFVHAR